ncbi:Catalase [Orbilia brochopaga]|nr:Catalase [Drechslerella brochopaga]
MPLSTDEQVNVTANNLVQTLHAVFGPHPGYRANHSKGTLINGTFTPTPAATALTKAQHFQTGTTTPIIVRFSDSTGIPLIPDNNPEASPRGLAIRFMLGGRKHTDIVSHSIPFSPGRTGEDVLGLFQAVGATAQHTGGSPTPIEAFLGAHPEIVPFATAQKPTTESLVGQTYFAVNAFKFVNAEGKETFIRYRVLPTVGTRVLTDEEIKDKAPNFLFEEVSERLKGGPVDLKLVAQIAEEGDVINDGTNYWPDTREIVELGTLKLEAEQEKAENDANQKYIIFDPIPRVDGIEASDDPLLDVRASMYLISGRERRAAPELKP